MRRDSEDFTASSFKQWPIGSMALVMLGIASSGAVLGQDWEPPPGPECHGEFSSEELSREEIEQILSDHAAWLSDSSREVNDPRRADLCEADLSGTDLNGVNLSNANLVRADLTEVDLSLADLTDANLYAASLHRSNLTRARLAHATLTEADLAQVDLTEADLSGADLSGVDLEGARLFRSTLTGAAFAPEIFPGVEAFAGVRGLSNVRIGGSNLASPMEPLVRLRETFRAAGFRSHARAMTSAIRKNELEGATDAERFFQNILAGGKLTDFGANPWGALRWLGISIPLFFFPYYAALRIGRQNHGIWRCRPKERILKCEGEPERELLRRGWLGAIPWALYFSVLSAFHFGWQQLNLGNWMVRLQGREYTLEATGWVRTTAGIQALFSLYVVALFLLTYFGEPFA